MDSHTADAVYVGTSTDTGCFRFANTTAHTFHVAAVCAEAGARVYQLNQELFETNSLAKLRLQAWMIEHMELFDEGKLAIVAIVVLCAAFVIWWKFFRPKRRYGSHSRRKSRRSYRGRRRR